MKTSLTWVAVWASLVTAYTVAAEPYLGTLGPYIEVPTAVDAQIQKIEYPPQIRSLSDKLAENLERNKEWFLQYREQVAPDQRVPYHPNMGLTETQYQELFGAEAQKRLTPYGGTRLSFSWRDDDVLQITGLPDDPPLDSLIYEGVSDSLLTSFGTITGSVPAKGKMGDDTSLAWEGRVWSTQRKDDKGQLSIVYVIGDLTESNHGVLIHEIKGVVNDAVVEHHYMVMWNK